ncbi:MAG: cobalamin biosynthesis protein CbiG [Lachnospiraceae bacterium]|nr:cobalamin biosynthesis protein CbiG [Lachnospiraceae bacterium]
MRLAIISFTERGGRLNRLLCSGFGELGYDVDGFEKRALGKEESGREEGCQETRISGTAYVTESLREWTGKAFAEYDGLIFVGACGIAVRAIAPFLKDKFQDPAVVAIDEGAGFAIPLLSGHVGGANDLGRLTARLSGAAPVVSTATDLNGLFAVDVFAKKNHLFLSDRELAKKCSAKVVAGKQIPFYSSQPVCGKLPGELVFFEEKDEFLRQPGLKVAVSEQRFFGNGEILYLVPKTVTAGMGCRRGIQKEQLFGRLQEAFFAAGIFMEALEQVATIEKKKEEEGLKKLVEELSVAFLWYTGEELGRLSGAFSHSGFVEETVGVDCVCERAAVMGSGGGALLFSKQAGEGITVAAAKREQKLRFDW